MRCRCNRDATNGCNGDILWWDHACWYMINNVERFFDDENYPTLNAKFAAFMVWMSRVGCQVIKSHIVFMYHRKWMTETAVQFAAFPTAKLLDKYPDMVGFRKIERLLKLTSFSIANPETSSQGPPSKRQRFNLNTPPSNSQPPRYNGGSSRGRGGRFQAASHRGRGGRGQHFGRGNTPNKANHGSPITPQTVRAFGFADARTNHRVDSPICGRILSFEEEL